MWEILLSLLPSTFVKQYMIFFHISISWKYIYSSTCRVLCLYFNLPYCGWIHKTFPHFTFVEDVENLRNIMLSLWPSIFVEKYMVFFQIPILWKLDYYSTFNISRGLCRGLLLEYIILFHISLLSKYIYIVFHLSHLWKNTEYSSTFLFRESGSLVFFCIW